MNTKEERSDAQLVAATLRDPAEYEHLMRRYTPKLLRYALRRANINRDDAEDIVQITFMKAYYALEGFDPSRSFSSWIYSIARNESVNDFRRRSKDPQPFAGESSKLCFLQIPSKIDPIRDFDQKITQETIQGVIEGLADPYRRVLTLHFLEERPYSEISKILKRPTGTIGTIIHRGKQMLLAEIIRIPALTSA